MINKTQLYIDKAMDRGIIHRDYIAHCLRWSHILRFAMKHKEKLTILDIGCGDFPLLKVLYTNRVHPKYYLGIDVRNLTLPDDVKPNLEWEFMRLNVINSIPTCKYKQWDAIVSFEVLEHNTKENGITILNNIRDIMSNSTTLFISTPCFNGSKAQNHIYEWRFNELKEELNKLFIIYSVYGTFASQRDIEPHLSESELEIYTRQKEYYDSHLIAILMAPLFPQYSRNCLWKCGKK